MATTPANLMQTAVNGAVTLVSAYVQAGLISSIDEARATFDTERQSIFGTLEGMPNDAPRTAPARSGNAPAAGGGGGKQFTADEARAIDLIFGKFKGVTLGELEGMTGAQAAEYGYGDGEKSGLQYLKYLANNDDPKGSFTKRAASAILEERRAQAA
jgi:hypothetical protein